LAEAITDPLLPLHHILPAYTRQIAMLFPLRPLSSPDAGFSNSQKLCGKRESPILPLAEAKRDNVLFWSLSLCDGGEINDCLAPRKARLSVAGPVSHVAAPASTDRESPGQGDGRWRVRRNRTRA
jgi:hypothetical protein